MGGGMGKLVNDEIRIFGQEYNVLIEKEVVVDDETLTQMIAFMFRKFTEENKIDFIRYS